MSISVAKAIFDSLIANDPGGWYGHGDGTEGEAEYQGIGVDARFDFIDVAKGLESKLKDRVLYLEAGIKTYLEDNHTIPRDEFFTKLLAGTISGEHVKADKE